MKKLLLACTALICLNHAAEAQVNGGTSPPSGVTSAQIVAAGGALQSYVNSQISSAIAGLAPTYTDVYLTGLNLTCASDDSTIIQNAINAASNYTHIILPGGCLGINSMLTLPGTASWSLATNKDIRISGQGRGVTVIKALASMSAVVEKDANYAEGGGLEDLTLDGSNEATYVLNHESGRKFIYNNIELKNAASGGTVLQVAASNGSGGYYPAIENTFENIHMEGIDSTVYAYTVMPAYGLVNNATDNDFINIDSYNATVPFYDSANAAGSRYSHLHSYGYGTTPNNPAWEPTYCFQMLGFFGTYDQIQCDAASIDAAQVAGFNTQIYNSVFQWGAGDSVGSAKGIELISGVGNVVAQGNSFLNTTPAAAIVATSISSSPTSVNKISNNPGASYVSGVLDNVLGGVIGSNSNSSTVLGINGVDTTTNSLNFLTDGNLAASLNVMGTKSGSNAGSDFYIDQYADNGSTFLRHALQITRSNGAATFAGSLTTGGTIAGPSLYSTTSFFALSSVNGNMASFYAPSSAIDYLSFNSAISGAAPVISASGATNVGITISPAGTGLTSVTSALSTTGQTTVGSSAITGASLVIGGNAAGTFPTQNTNGGIGVNFTNGGKEIDFWNTNSSPTTAFNWYQQTAASTDTTLMTLSPTGALVVTGPISGTTITTTGTSSIPGYLTTASASTTYAPLASPTFTGTATAANLTVTGTLSATISGYAPIASPTFTGTVTIPAGAAISGYLTTASASSTYAPLASPTFTGTLTAAAIVDNGTLYAAGTLTTAGNLAIGATNSGVNVNTNGTGSMVFNINDATDLIRFNNFKSSAYNPLLDVGGNPNNIKAYAPIFLNPPTTWNSISNTSGFYENQTVTGSSTATTYYNLLQLADSVADTSSGGSILLNLSLSPTTGAKGTKTGVQSEVTLTNTSANTTGGTYIAGTFGVAGNANDNGTSITSAGQAFAINPKVQLSSSATYWNSAIVQENDMLIPTGASTTLKVGEQIVETIGDAVQGSFDDVAFSITNQFTQGTGATGWKYGIMFGRNGGYFPITTTGTLIAAATSGGTLNVANGLYLPNVTFSGYSIDVPGFTVNGSGAVNALSLTTTGTSSIAGYAPLASPTFTGTLTAAAITDTGGFNFGTAGSGYSTFSVVGTGGMFLNLSGTTGLFRISEGSGATDIFDIGGGSPITIQSNAPIRLNPPATWAGYTSNAGIYQNEILSGSSSTDTYYNLLQVVDNIADSSAQGSSALSVSLLPGGTSSSGTKNSLISSFNMTTASGNNTGSGGAYTSAQFTSHANNNDNGISGTNRGLLYGTNVVGHLGPSSTYWQSLMAQESDVEAESGASVAVKLGEQIVLVTNDAVQGSSDDAALSINNQYTQGTGATGWKYGIMFGRNGGYFPMTTTGTLIAAATPSGTLNVANGLYLPNVTFSGYSIDVPGFTVNGSGAVNALSLTATGTSSIAGYAPLASPSFTGNPAITGTASTTPIPLYFDSTGVLATSLNIMGAKSGSNVGSDFYIDQYDDTGTFLRHALQITRSTGYATFTGGGMTVGGTLAFSGLYSSSSFLTLSSVNGNMIAFYAPTSAVNYPSFNSAVSGSPVVLGVAGSTNVGINITPAGSGTTTITNGGLTVTSGAISAATITTTGTSSIAGYAPLASPVLTGITNVGSGSTAALGVGVSNNAGGTYPAFNGSSLYGGIGWNFTSGSKEIDEWNTLSSPTVSFNWYQELSASTNLLLMSLSPAGNLTVTGTAKLGSSGASFSTAGAITGVASITLTTPFSAAVLGTSAAGLIQSSTAATVATLLTATPQPLSVTTLTDTGETVLNSATALATTATTGFVHLPHSAGIPTGTPTNTTVACEWDTTNHVLNCYDSSGWYHITATSGGG